MLVLTTTAKETGITNVWLAFSVNRWNNVNKNDSNKIEII